jgi:hypothetical protein
VQADGAEVVAGDVGEESGEVALEVGAGLVEGPAVILEERLQRAGGDAGGQRDGLAGLAGQVGEEPAAVDAEQVEGLGVVAAEEERPQVVGEGRPEFRDLIRRPGNLRGVREVVYGFEDRQPENRSAGLLDVSQRSSRSRRVSR